MSKKEGYENKLYYPHRSTYNESYGYWIASPSTSATSFVLRVLYSGRVGYETSTVYGDYDYNSLSVRPVVSLNTGITVNATDEE